MTDSRAVLFKYRQIGRLSRDRRRRYGERSPRALLRIGRLLARRRGQASPRLLVGGARRQQSGARRSQFVVNDALFDGLLDDFGIYKRALTAAEILALP